MSAARTLQHLSDVSAAPILTGLLSLAAMQLLPHVAPRVPAALVVAVVATVLIGLLGGEAAGIRVVGKLPSGLVVRRNASPRNSRA